MRALREAQPERPDAETSKYYDIKSKAQNSSDTQPEQKEKAAVAASRQEILQRYKITKEHALGMVKNKNHNRKRDICVFYILKNKHLPEKTYYADGFVPHSYLMEKILERFGQEIGVKQTSDLDEHFFKKWIVYKGFIDPYQQHFRQYQKIEKNIKADLLRYAAENELSPEIIEKLKNNQPTELPNWFTAYTSSQL